MKYKRVVISPDLLLMLFTPGFHAAGYAVTKDGIPGDAELLNVHHCWPNKIERLIKSETFDAVKCGDEIPLCIPEITREAPKTS
jgi:hypothetical protein